MSLRSFLAAVTPRRLRRVHRYAQPAGGFVAYETLPLIGVIAFIAADGERVTRW